MAKKAKAAKKKVANGGKKAGGDFVVRSRVKEAIAKKNLRSSGDLAEALNGMISWYLDQAAARAKANRRGTVRGHDICCC